MGILSNIFNKIFHPANAATNNESSASTTSAQAPTSVPQGGNVNPAPTAMAEVDVEAVLNGMAQNNSQKLNWRTSIVDLLKLLDLDSSLTARKELAQELNYSGDMNDSATMNIWLHKQVMKKLAENGGKVPADLKD
jgi:hypothetical protein